MPGTARLPGVSCGHAVMLAPCVKPAAALRLVHVGPGVVWGMRISAFGGAASLLL